MAAIWSDKNRFQIMFQIELLAAKALAEAGRVPMSFYHSLNKISPDQIDPKRVAELERASRHETVALLNHIEELAGPDGARFLHLGMTSSDVLDTCLSLQLNQAADLIIDGIDVLCDALKIQAHKHKLTLCAGRSHGMHAEPTTFGLKMAQAFAEMRRNRARMVSARQQISFGAVSGPVGNFSHIDPQIEAQICQSLHLKPEPISTQVIPRDRHAAYFSTLGVVASSLERIAIELRSLQRTEIGEIEEAFGTDQTGSSAMPHKKNPILAENITGLARLIRTQVLAALENVSLWHERDMSHSSVERMIAPDATVTLDFALARLAGVVDRLVVYPERMREHLDALGGLIHSQRVLLALVEAGMSREDAYAAVQRNAMAVWEKGGDFLALLQGDAEVTRLLDKDGLARLFDLDHHLAHVDTIFDRVFGAG